MATPMLSELSLSVLGIRDEKARMKVTPPLAVALIAQEDDMRWNIELAIGSRWSVAAQPPVTSSLGLDIEASGHATQRATWDLCVASFLQFAGKLLK